MFDRGSRATLRRMRRSISPGSHSSGKPAGAGPQGRILRGQRLAHDPERIDGPVELQPGLPPG